MYATGGIVAKWQVMKDGQHTFNASGTARVSRGRYADWLIMDRGWTKTPTGASKQLEAPANPADWLEAARTNT